MAAAERDGRARTVNDGSGGAPSAACPCGAPLDAGRGRCLPRASSSLRAESIGRWHVVCLDCQARVERHIARRFGSHRYGGRFASHLGDFVQECYVKLHREGGVDSFVPPPDVQGRCSAFRGWLWTVVHNHCNVTLEYWRRRLDEQRLLEMQRVRRGERPSRPLTPEQAFMQQFSVTLVQTIIETVRRQWEARGKGEPFAILIAFIGGDGTSYAEVAARLGVTEGYARVLVHQLRRDLRAARIEAVRDTLDLPWGLDPASAMRLIEEEIDQIMSAWHLPAADDVTDDGGFEK